MTARSDDPLLSCLMALCRHYGNADTTESLTNGLPLVDGYLTSSLFERAARRAGLTSRIVKRDVNQLDRALLPVVVLRKDEGACLFMGLDESGSIAQVVYPEIEETVVDVPLEQLKEVSEGRVILCRPKFRFDERAPRTMESSRGHWFWDAVKESLPLYRDVLFAAFFINLFALAMPLFIRNVYDRVVPNNAIETLWVLVAGISIVFVAEFVLRMMRIYFVDRASKRIDVSVSAGMMERVLGMKLENKPSSVGSYASNLRSFETIRDFTGSASVITLVDLPFAIIFLVVIAWISWWLLIPPLIGIAVIVAYSFLIQNRITELSETVYRAGAMRNATLIEGLVGLETVKAMSAESALQRRWEEATSFLAHVGMQMRVVSSSAVTASQFVQNMVLVFVIVTGIYLISAGELSMGALVATHLLVSRAMAPFGRTANLLTQYHGSKVALVNLDKLMETPTERPKKGSYLSRGNYRGDIEFKNVSFTYPGSDMESLSDVSFKIRRGEHVAILGRVGSGKSTLQKLSLGLFQPTSGSIFIDGIDLRQLDPSEFRSSVGYVPQEVILFFGSLRENLTLAYPEASDRAILRATRMADLDAFVNRHPRGFDMPVGERGESLSGGQRKAVAVARAMIREPNVVFMDEPTGGMDRQTENAVQRRIGRYIKGRTFMVVTHKQSFLELVDRIIVLDGGRLIADGPKEQVMEALSTGSIGGAK